jgi:hypothetical protein
MADNKNIIIGLLVVIIILLAFFAFRPIKYSPGYNQNNPANNPNGYHRGHMGPGMMNTPGYNYGYGPGMMGNQSSPMGPEMMYNQSSNYSYVSGMMGSMMTGNMMAIYYPESKPITQDAALKNMENFSRQYSSNTEVDDFMTFSSNYYAVVKDTSTGQDIAEILVDRYSGTAYPEPGPNMMWNTRYSSGTAQNGSSVYDLTAAKKLAEDFLTGYLPGAQIQESHALPGYYTFDFGRNETESMLSVNAYSGQIWVHTWHGSYIGGMNTTS